MSTLTKVTLACVPEHFSVPLHLPSALANYASKAGVELNVRIAKGGTGEMVGLLESGEIDVAVALTEGIVAAIANNPLSKIKLISTYVSSSLNWGVSVNPHHSPASKIPTMLDIPLGSDIIVSRMGSGSHVMAVVLEDRIRELKKNNGGEVEEKGFGWCIAKDWEGMRRALAEDKGKAMMWEYFTTKPWYDSGELRHCDTLTPPWPAFVIAANADSISRITPSVLSQLLQQIVLETQTFKKDKQGTVKHLTGEPFNYKPEDAEKWLAGTEWSAKSGEISRRALEETVDVLLKAGVVKEMVGDVGQWVAEGVGKLV